MDLIIRLWRRHPGLCQHKRHQMRRQEAVVERWCLGYVNWGQLCLQSRVIFTCIYGGGGQFVNKFFLTVP